MQISFPLLLISYLEYVYKCCSSEAKSFPSRCIATLKWRLLWWKCSSSKGKGILATGTQGTSQSHTVQQTLSKRLTGRHTRGCLPLLWWETEENWAGDRLNTELWGEEFSHLEISRVRTGGISSPQLGLSSGIGGIASLGVSPEIGRISWSGICGVLVRNFHKESGSDLLPYNVYQNFPHI